MPVASGESPAAIAGTRRRRNHPQPLFFRVHDEALTSHHIPDEGFAGTREERDRPDTEPQSETRRIARHRGERDRSRNNPGFHNKRGPRRHLHLDSGNPRPADRRDFLQCRRTHGTQRAIQAGTAGQEVHNVEVQCRTRFHTARQATTRNAVFRHGRNRENTERLLPDPGRAFAEAHDDQGHRRADGLRHIRHLPGHQQQIRRHAVGHIPAAVLLLRQPRRRRRGIHQQRGGGGNQGARRGGRQTPSAQRRETPRRARRERI